MNDNELYTLKISNKRGGTIGFLFDTEARCQKCYDELRNAMPGMSTEEARGLELPIGSQYVQVHDSYGNRGTIDCHDIASLWFTDVAREMEGQQKYGLMTARAQQKAQRAAQADPLLNGSGLVQPGGVIDGSFRRGN